LFSHNKFGPILYFLYLFQCHPSFF
jgi:hypothetical protein